MLDLSRQFTGAEQTLSKPFHTKSTDIIHFVGITSYDVGKCRSVVASRMMQVVTALLYLSLILSTGKWISIYFTNLQSSSSFVNFYILTSLDKTVHDCMASL